MSLVFAAFLLGAVPSPPPEDDDKVEQPHRAVSPPVPAPDDDNDKPKVGASSKAADHGANDEADEESRAQPSSTIIVIAHRLDAARTQIDAGLGATVYSLNNDTIENRPGGETGKLADILTQAPGVTLSGKTLNVRGSPANQVRINNVIVPEAISDPADLLSSRMAETTRLITGTLPAQFGFAPAGVISVTTKNGLYQHGGQAELFAGSDGMIEPAFEWTGSAAATSLFASGELERGRSTIGDLQGNSTRDRRTAIDGLGFADHVIDQHNRISFLFGGSHERHSIGETSIGSGAEANDDAYAVATFQHSAGRLTLQTSLFGGISSDQAQFNTATHERRGSWGTQVDASDSSNADNIVRFGLLATRSTARELNLVGGQANEVRTSVAIYAQDEWTLAPSLTFNPGARVEWLRGFNSGAKLEPRASLVWGSPDGLTMHLGYASYASAPPLGEKATGLPLERDDYFDVGVQQKLGAFTFGADGYWRSVHNYIAEHQALGSAVATPFEFKRARIKGLEFFNTYARRGTTAWANLSLASAEGRTIIGGEGIFPPQSITAADGHGVRLASDRPLTVSAGATQRVGKFSIGGDVVASSGAVRTLNVADPNGGRHSAYALLGLSAVYHARIAGQPADLRVDLTNLTNVHYATSDAANLEGGWTRWGAGRAITIGIEQGF